MDLRTFKTLSLRPISKNTYNYSKIRHSFHHFYHSLLNCFGSLNQSSCVVSLLNVLCFMSHS